jgi:hypothetical protein
MLFITIVDETDAAHDLKAKNAYEMLPLFKTTLTSLGFKKPRDAEITKHDLDMVLSTETCDRHLSSFQRKIKAHTKVHRIPHRTYKGQVMTLRPEISA